MGFNLPPLSKVHSRTSSGKMGMNYKREWKDQKVKITELELQIVTLKARMETLRKAKNQTILKTEIVHRDISEPQFNNYHHNVENGHTKDGDDQSMVSEMPCLDLNTYVVEETKPVIETVEKGINTTSPGSEVCDPPKRKTRLRTRENWSQCKIFTDNKMCQIEMVQRCHCEGLPDSRTPSAMISQPASHLPDIFDKTNVEARDKTPTLKDSFRTISRQNTNEYISLKQHNSDIKQIESSYKSEREKLKSVQTKEISTYRQTIQSLNQALKNLVEKNVKTTINTPNGSSLFHMYAEEKGRLESDIKGFSSDNTKLRKQVKDLKREVKEKDDEWQENEDAIKQHYANTWDEQYRSWMSKTDVKLNNLRDANGVLQEFIQKNAQQLMAMVDGLVVLDEFGEEVSVL